MHGEIVLWASWLLGIAGIAFSVGWRLKLLRQGRCSSRVPTPEDYAVDTLAWALLLVAWVLRGPN